MTEWLITIIVSVLLTVGFGFLVLHLKFLSKRIDSLDTRLHNHVEAVLLQLTEKIGELKGRIKIND
jgi:hypothetical protein